MPNIANTIRSDSLFAWMTSEEFFGVWLAPYLASISTVRSTRSPWPWAKRRSAEGVLDHTWNMLGRWKARRAIKVDKRLFDEVVPAQVRRVSACLNDHRVRSLSDFAGMRQSAYEQVIGVAQDAVLQVSAVKPTKVVVSMFGSKVLHHYFPSVVPVYDDRMIRKGAMLLPTYKACRTGSRRSSSPSAGGLPCATRPR